MLPASGAAIELTFTFDRAQIVRTWAGAIRPEFTATDGSITSKTQVGEQADSDPTHLETSCGA